MSELSTGWRTLTDAACLIGWSAWAPLRRRRVAQLRAGAPLRRILVLHEVRGLGNTVLLSGLLRNLRRSYPEASIALAMPSSPLAQSLLGPELVDEFLFFDPPVTSAELPARVCAAGSASATLRPRAGHLLLSDAADVVRVGAGRVPLSHRLRRDRDARGAEHADGARPGWPRARTPSAPARVHRPEPRTLDRRAWFSRGHRRCPGVPRATRAGDQPAAAGNPPGMRPSERVEALAGRALCGGREAGRRRWVGRCRRLPGSGRG